MSRKNINKEVYKYIIILGGLILLCIVLFMSTYVTKDDYGSSEAYLSALNERALSSVTAYAFEVEEMYEEKYVSNDTEVANAYVDFLLMSMSGTKYSFSQTLESVNIALLNSSLSEEELFENPEALKSDVAINFIKDLKKNHINLKLINNIYETEIDYGYVYSTYGMFVTEDFRVVLQYFSESDFYKIGDSEKGFNIAYLVERIDTADVLLDKYPDSGYLINLEYNQINFYEILFGLNHSSFIDNNLVYLDSYITQLRAIASGDTNIAIECQKFLDIIEDNNYTRNANIDVWLNDYFEERVGSI